MKKIFPIITLREGFEKGYDSDYIKRVIHIQKKDFSDQFERYPLPVREGVEREEVKISTEIMHTFAANILKEKVLKKLRSVAERHGIPMIVLKGMFLIENLYGDYSGVHDMCDIDVLLQKKDFHSSMDLFAEIGNVGLWNRQRPLYSRIYHEYPVKVDNVLVEIHRGQNPFDLFKMRYSDFFDGVNFEDDRFVSLEHMICFYLIHDFNDGLSMLTFKRAAKMFVLLHNADIPTLHELCHRYGIFHLLELYECILGEVFSDFKKSTSSDGKKFHKHLKRGSFPSVFKWDRGEIMFKISVFRCQFFKKALPNMLTFLPDLFLARISRSPKS